MLRQLVADEDAVNAEIYDVVGRSVYKDQLRFSSGKTNLRMVNGMPGMYMLRLKDSKGRMFMFKFVVE